MLNRRDLIRAAGLGAAGLSAGRLVRAAAAPKRPEHRPNIVLFISDDHGVDDSGAYGDGVVQTPNIDRLAGEGMRFTQAFAASPLCSPSRCVLETGLMPFRNGAHKFGTPISRGVRTMPQYFKRLGYHTAHVGKFHHAPRKQFPYDTVIRNENKGGEFIAGYKGDKPLLLLVCSTFPHTPWAKNAGYDPAKIKLPPTFVDTPLTRSQRCQYYTEVTMMDRQLGAVLAAIKKRRWAENTLVMYTSDQGSNWPFAKWCLYDAGIRVPLIARWPGKIRPGTVTDAMVSLADLMPTFMAAAGGQPPKGIDGRSFLDVLRGKKKGHRDAVFAAHTGNDNGGPGIANHCPMRAVRTATHKYILNLHPERTFTTHITGCRPGSPHHLPFWDSWVEKAKTDPRAAKVVAAYMHRPAEELYDLAKDPHEQKNLAADPARADLLASLRKRLTAWRKQQGDPTLGK